MHTHPHVPLLMTYLAATAHLVALAEALLLGGAQGVPVHNIITQGHMHAAAGLGLALKKERKKTMHDHVDSDT